MPRFHFNVAEGDRVIADIEGENLPNLDAARNEAINLAREIFADSVKSDRVPPDCIQVTDGDGQEVLSVSLADLLPASMRK